MNLRQLTEALEELYDLETRSKKAIEDVTRIYQEIKTTRQAVQAKLAQKGWFHKLLGLKWPSRASGEATDAMHEAEWKRLTQEALSRNRNQDKKSARVVSENISEWILNINKDDSKNE